MYWYIECKLSSQSVGLSELEKGYELETSIRRVLCAIVLLGYHLIIVYVLSNGEGNLVQANAILEEQLKVKFLLFNNVVCTHLYYAFVLLAETKRRLVSVLQR